MKTIHKKVYVVIIVVIALFVILSIKKSGIEINALENNIAFVDDRKDETIYFNLSNNLNINSRSKESGLEKSIYESDDNILLTQFGRMGENIVFLELYKEEEKGYYFEVNLLEKNEVELIEKGLSYNVPCIGVGDKSITISYEWGGHSKLEYVDISGKKEYITDTSGNSHRKSNKEILLTKNFTEYDNGKYKGDKIIYSGGTDNIIWAQIISADNENMEDASKMSLAKIDKMSGEIINFDIPHKSIYVYGNDKYVILSDYSSLEPLMESGIIYKVNGSNLKLVKTLSKVESGNDIKDVKFLGNDEVLILTPKAGYYCNLETGEEKIYEFKENYYASIKGLGFELWKAENEKAKIEYIKFLGN